jgi:hypothetical protein
VVELAAQIKPLLAGRDPLSYELFAMTAVPITHTALCG